MCSKHMDPVTSTTQKMREKKECPPGGLDKFLYYQYTWLTSKPCSNFQKKICVDPEPSLQIQFFGPFLNCLLSRSSLCCADSGSILSEFIKMKCTNLTLPLRFWLIEEVCRGNSLTNVVTVRDSDVMR